MRRETGESGDGAARGESNVLERNLARLLARAFAPVLPRVSFRARLRRDFLARAARLPSAGAVVTAAPPGPRRFDGTSRRWLAAAALALALGAVVWTLARGRGPGGSDAGLAPVASEGRPEVAPTGPRPDSVGATGELPLERLAPVDAESDWDLGRSAAALSGGGEPGGEAAGRGAVEEGGQAAAPVQLRGRVLLAADGAGDRAPEESDPGADGLGAPVRRFRVSALALVALPAVAEPRVFEFDDPQGRFELSGLAAGTYELFVQAERRAPWRSGPLELGPELDVAGGANELSIRLGPGARLEGLVVDGATGLVVPNALVVSETDAPVQILSLDASEYAAVPGLVPAARTGADGGFELAGLSPGEHALRVTAPGHAPLWQRGEASDQPSRERFELGPGGSLEGTVSQGGLPLEGAMVILSLSDFSATHPVMSYCQTFTDADGGFELEDLPAGFWPLLSFGRFDERAGPLEPEMAFVRIEAGARTTRDFAAAAAGVRFEGRIVGADGEPLAGRAIWLTPVDATDGRGTGAPMAEFASTTSDAEGRFAFGALAPERYVVCTSRGSPADMLLLERLDLSDGAHALERVLRLGGGRIAGRVLDGGAAAGVGLARAVVLVFERAPGGELEFVARAFSGPDGAFDVAHLPAGRYGVQVVSSAPAYGHAAAGEHELAEGGALDLGELFLYPGGTLELEAHGPGGAPAAGASVSFHRPAGGAGQRTDAGLAGNEVHLLESQVLDERGRLLVPALDAGRWVLSIRGPGFAPATVEVDVARSETPTRVEVELEQR